MSTLIRSRDDTALLHALTLTNLRFFASQRVNFFFRAASASSLLKSIACCMSARVALNVSDDRRLAMGCIASSVYVADVSSVPYAM